jgi:hypothetical protein
LNYIKSLFDDNLLFAAITNKNDRKSIWRSLTAIRGLVPTLDSFFQDVKFLKPISKAMKHFLGEPSQKYFLGSTIDTTLTECFSGENQTSGRLLLQQSDTKLTAVSGNASDQVKFGNLILWLFAARHWPQMIEECPRTEKGAAILRPLKPNEATWHVFAVLALQLGYSSNRIRELALTKPLEKFRPAMVGSEGRPIFTTLDSGEDLDRRWGRVFQKAHEFDRQFLFLNMLYEQDKSIGMGISSFYVRQSVWFAFFERILPSQSVVHEPNVNPFRSLIDASNSTVSLEAIGMSEFIPALQSTLTR